MYHFRPLTDGRTPEPYHVHSSVDLHMHSTTSDGDRTPEELVRLVRDAGIRTFALTDHDTIDGIAAIESCIPEDMTFIPGIEFSCMTEGFKYHLLGYAYDSENQPFRDFIRKAQKLRSEKMVVRVGELERKYHIFFPEEELQAVYRAKSPNRSALADLLVRHGICQNSEEAFRKYLNALPSFRVEGADAIRVIREAGGIPVWAHPFGENRREERSVEEFERLLDILISLGLQGLECWYNVYDYERRQFLIQTAEKRGLWISGGSDFHGFSRKPNQLGDLGVYTEGDPEETPELTVLEGLRVRSVNR